MHWKKRLYCVHRWLGLIVSLQLLAWSTGGFMFSILDIGNVRGELDSTLKAPPAIRLDRLRVSVAEAFAKVEAVGVAAQEVVEVRLRERRGKTVYELYGAESVPLAAVNGVSGEVIKRISEEEAKSAALADFKPEASVKSVRFLEADPPLEYRGKPMPVYQVILDHPKKPHIYVSPVTAEVITRRNRPWRIFDFFWMLHIMDYRDRDDFNHLLLTAMSALAILTSASGLVLWVLRSPLGRRRR